MIRDSDIFEIKKNVGKLKNWVYISTWQVEMERQEVVFPEINGQNTIKAKIVRQFCLADWLVG